nr:hypothetical protein [Mucilaginibacter sp. SP1R1]
MHSRISDFLIIETHDLKEYGYLIGYLRESKTFAAPYSKLEDIIIGVSNNFRGSLNFQDISTLG